MGIMWEELGRRNKRPAQREPIPLMWGLFNAWTRSQATSWVLMVPRYQARARRALTNRLQGSLVAWKLRLDSTSQRPKPPHQCLVTLGLGRTRPVKHSASMLSLVTTRLVRDRPSRRFAQKVNTSQASDRRNAWRPMQVTMWTPRGLLHRSRALLGPTNQVLGNRNA